MVGPRGRTPQYWNAFTGGFPALTAVGGLKYGEYGDKPYLYSGVLKGLVDVSQPKCMRRRALQTIRESAIEQGFVQLSYEESPEA